MSRRIILGIDHTGLEDLRQFFLEAFEDATARNTSSRGVGITFEDIQVCTLAVEGNSAEEHLGVTRRLYSLIDLAAS